MNYDDLHRPHIVFNPRFWAGCVLLWAGFIALVLAVWR